MTKIMASLLGIALLSIIAGCTTPPSFEQSNIDDLASEIQMLGPEVDPEEAQRAAKIAYTYSLQLAEEYQITDPPIIHNAKVNTGLRKRGLCNHWTEDLNKRLKGEHFRTLAIHWATSPPTPFRIIHHSVVVSKRGDTIYDGILLDPWRHGGILYWLKTQSDERYDWRPRLEVREQLINARRTSNATN